ncbi:hypothetical protein HDU77_005723 [Chytriomyces hyalinus]|nr:hypothetical protein HDU77_005723 [Chytriomyces hyalinus]
MAPSSRKRSSANAGSTPYARNANSSRVVSNRTSAGSGGSATNPPETPVGNSIFSSLLRVLSTPLTLLSSSSNLDERDIDDSDRGDGSEFDDEDTQEVNTIPKHVAAEHGNISESPTPADQTHLRTSNKSKFNSLLNHPAVSPIPSSSSQSVLENLANTPFGSSYSPTTSTTAQKNSNASPSKYDDIVSLLSRKGDQPLSVSEAQTLQNLIRKNMEETPSKSRSSAQNDPFRQSVALSMSDLSPSIDAKESSHAGSAPAPLFTFGATAAASTVTSAASLFGPSKPMFAPVFTFKSQAPQNASLAAQSRSIFSAASDQMAASESSALLEPQQNRAIPRRRTTALRNAAPLYQGASFGVVTPLRKRVGAVGTRPSLRQPQPASQEAFGAEPHSKRHRLDGDEYSAEDGTFKKRARRDVSEGLATDNNFENDTWTQDAASSSDSASKLILETLEDMAPPPTNLLSLAPDFSFTKPPASMPPVVVHQTPKASSGPKILATTRKVEAAITATSAKPKSALVNARISQLVQFPIRPTVGGTPSRPSNKNTGKLKATEPLPAGEAAIHQRAAFPIESKPSQKSDILTPHSKVPSTSRDQEVAVTVPETTPKASAPANLSSVKSARFGFGIPATVVASTPINSVHGDSMAVTSAVNTTGTFSFGSKFAEQKSSALMASASAVNDLKSVNQVDSESETGQSPSYLNATFKTKGKLWDEVKLLSVSVLPVFNFESGDSNLTPISQMLMSQYPDILHAIPAIQQDELAKYNWEPMSAGVSDKSEQMDVLPSMPGGFDFDSSPSEGGFSFAMARTPGFSLGFASTKVTESAQKAAEWVCDKCLVVNDNTQTQCVACEAVKGGGAAVSAGPKNWVCDTCLVENQQTAQICIACETGRSAEVKKKSSLWG